MHDDDQQNTFRANFGKRFEVKKKERFAKSQFLFYSTKKEKKEGFVEYFCFKRKL